VANAVGFRDSEAATLTVVSGISLADALDAPGLSWNTGGGSVWDGQTGTSHDGTDAAETGQISHDQQSWMETTVRGPGQLSFWWKTSCESGYDFLELSANGVPQTGRISGEVDWQQLRYIIPAGNFVLRWTYTKDGSVDEGKDAGWVDQVSFVPEDSNLALAEALDGPGLTWVTGGTASWSGQTATTRDSVDAAQSGSISHNQHSWMETTVAAGGTLTFWWKVSSEADYDFLEFYIDGILQNGRIAGEVNWTQQTFTLGPGPHTLRWRYAKDEAVISGQDRGWVDQVSFVPAAAQPPTLVAPKYIAGGRFQCDVTGSPGMTYVVLGSTDFLNWTPLATNTAPFTFTDPAANGLKSRVYRVRSAP